VLVESTPGGGRRRVLRPWGLRSSAPLTESPALPEMAAARKAAKRASRGSRRPLHKIAAGLAGVVALSGVIAYPYTLRDEQPSARGEEVVSKAASQVVAIADLTAVKERIPSPVADPEPTPEVVAPASKPSAQVATDPSPRLPARPQVVEAAQPAPETGVAEPSPAVVPTPPVQEPARTPADPWQALRNALDACSRVQGLWDRATCEQRARLDSCDGNWGVVALCPAGRTEFGQ
jgi:hypothetical protein